MMMMLLMIMMMITMTPTITTRRFRLAMHDMIGYYPSYFFVACWSVITPTICAGVFFFKVFIVTSIIKIS